MIKRKNRLLLTWLSIALMLSACGDEPQSPEQQVRDTLQAMQDAAEQRSISDFMDYVAQDYSDHRGNDKDAIRRVMQLLFLRNQSINIFTRIQSLEIQNNIAAVELSAAIASRGVDLSLETNRLKADTHHFSVVLTQANETEWQVKSVSWKRGWGNG